ncbi:MAG: L,D-transpeptidase family protein [Phycisphaerales bacterium]
MNRRTAAVVLLSGVLIVGGLACVPLARTLAWSALTRLKGRETVQGVVDRIGLAARARLGVSGKPREITFVAFKRERKLDVYIGTDAGERRRLKSYPILAASGGPGPKTRQGDNHVPEGVYRVESLNPNSAFHLALRLNYPSPEDLEAAQSEGRDPGMLGSDIMIHGKAASVGCLAMGDEAIEELFTLAADAGLDHVTVLILPHDLRVEPVSDARPWVAERYRRLTTLLPPP